MAKIQIKIWNVQFLLTVFLHSFYFFQIYGVEISDLVVLATKKKVLKWGIKGIYWDLYLIK